MTDTEHENLCIECGNCNGCPEYIDIPKYMDSYNMYILEKDKNAIVNRLKYHWGIERNIAKNCIVCKKCEKRCPQHLNIIDRLREISELKL